MTVVLFDVDGTLVRAGGAGRRALEAAFRAEWGVEAASRGVEFAGKTDLQNFNEVFQQGLGRRPKRAELDRAIAAYVRRLPREVRRSVRGGRYETVEGVVELVKALARRADVVLGLGTGNVEEGARIKLGPSRLNRYFRFGGFGGDGVLRHQILRAGVRRSRARPRRVVIIGDTPRDVEGGRRAGFATGAVWAGFGSASALRRARPDFLARDFRPTERWLHFVSGNGRN